MYLRKELSMSSARKPDGPKCIRNQMTIHIEKMMVPALMINALALSHTWMSTPFTVGM